jgi:hypothetical protein
MSPPVPGFRGADGRAHVLVLANGDPYPADVPLPPLPLSARDVLEDVEWPREAIQRGAEPSRRIRQDSGAVPVELSDVLRAPRSDQPDELIAPLSLADAAALRDLTVPRVGDYQVCWVNRPDMSVAWAAAWNALLGAGARVAATPINGFVDRRARMVYVQR